MGIELIMAEERIPSRRELYKSMTLKEIHLGPPRLQVLSEAKAAEKELQALTDSIYPARNRGEVRPELWDEFNNIHSNFHAWKASNFLIKGIPVLDLLKARSTYRLLLLRSYRIAIEGMQKSLKEEIEYHRRMKAHAR